MRDRFTERDAAATHRYVRATFAAAAMEPLEQVSDDQSRWALSIPAPRGHYRVVVASHADIGFGHLVEVMISREPGGAIIPGGFTGGDRLTPSRIANHITDSVLTFESEQPALALGAADN